MDADLSRQAHLTHISTLWTVVRNAHGADETTARTAQARLIERYSPAVYRYLLAVLRDEHAADEVFQEFAVRLLRGGFVGADPTRGRFRDYLKTAILHLVTDFRRGAARRRRERPFEAESQIPAAPGPGLGPAPGPGPAPGSGVDADDRLFLHSWREALLGRAWDALATHEAESKQPLYQVLRLRSEHAGADSEQLAATLTQRLSPARPFTAAYVRKVLQRARGMFAEVLVAEVAHSLASPTQAEIEQELIDLSLHAYCRSAVRRTGARAAASREP